MVYRDLTKRNEGFGDENGAINEETSNNARGFFFAQHCPLFIAV